MLNERTFSPSCIYLLYSSYMHACMRVYVYVNGEKITPCINTFLLFPFLRLFYDEIQTLGRRPFFPSFKIQNRILCFINELTHKCKILMNLRKSQRLGKIIQNFVYFYIKLCMLIFLMRSMIGIFK